MIQSDLTADRFAVYEGFRLADYRAVAVPYYVLYVQGILLERRALPPTTEFIFRAIESGITQVSDICKLLGLGLAFTTKLIGELEDDCYIQGRADGGLELCVRGKDLLDACYELIPEEQEVPILWNPIQRVPAKFVEELVREADVKREGVMLIQAHPMRPPNVNEISIHHVQAVWKQRFVDGQESKKEIIRLRNVVKRVLRFRPSVALVYVADKGADTRVKFAFDGVIDEEFSSAFASQNGPKRHGISEEFSKKTVAPALKQRLATISNSGTATSEYLQLIARRSALRIGVLGLEHRLIEEKSEFLLKKLAEKKSELDALEGSIQAAPVRQLFPFEIAQVLGKAIDAVRKELVITTTLPIALRCGGELIQRMHGACNRGIKIKIFISDRKTAVAGGQSLGGGALHELNRVAEKTSNLSVKFLAERTRAFFEILQDREFLAVSNEPPLGVRDIRITFRPFVGVAVSNATDISRYIEAFLNEENMKSVEFPASYFRRKTPPVGKSSP
jgi:hypothetical protein